MLGKRRSKLLCINVDKAEISEIAGDNVSSYVFSSDNRLYVYKEGEGLIRITDDTEECILEADAVVFSMPVYWYSIPAQIKGVIDKLYSFFIGGKAEQVAGKSAAIITCCEEADPSVMDGVKIPMERTAALLQWNMVGEVLVPGVNEADTDGCAQAAALADKF